jgi:SPP1 family predicted phage head-tail adaptor
LRIGRRDKRVTLQRFTATPNAYNELEKSWQDLDTVWAHLKTQSGKEALSAGQELASTTVVFNIRFKALTTQDRVLHNGQAYDIESLHELGRRKELELICTRRENE